MNDYEKLNFTKFPGFASFILEECLEEFTRMMIQYSIEEEVPILRLFSHLSQEELVSISIQPTADLLKVFIENRTAQFLKDSLKDYVEDKIPEVGREDILVKDITLGNFVRRKAFRNLLNRYTQDYELSSEIMEEIDRFIAISEGETFKAYLQIQQEKITRINEELSEGKEELLELQELADMGSFVWNMVDGTSQFTPGIMKILGTTQSVDTDAFMQKVHPEDQAIVKQAMDDAIHGNGIFESEYRYIVDGVQKNVWARGQITFENGIPVKMKGNVMDITDKHKLLAELKKSEALSKQSQALTHIGNWSWDAETNIVNWSDEMFRIYGLKPQSEQINFERFISLIHPEDRDKRVKEVQESFESLEAKDYLIRIINPNGTLKVLRGKGEVLVKDGKATGLVGTCQDITMEHNLNEELREKTKQLEKLNESLAAKNIELERTNKEMESFNYVASHDLQEPLRKIQIFTGRILEKGKDKLPVETSEYFEKILISSARMRLLIDDLLKFSRTSISESTFQPTDLNLVVEEVMQNMTQAIEEKKMIVEIDQLPVVEGINFQLQQLFSNLFSNSLKYAKENVVPKVNISSRIVSESDIPKEFNPIGQFHKIRFEDNGIGFDQQNAEKIFDLFQRLHGKDEYSGTGIGLAICKKIVYNHNGYITAESEPGKGSAFNIYLPA